MFENYYRAVNYIETLSNLPRADYMQEAGRIFYLHRTNELIKKLGINLKHFKYIHVGGTSGKGSVTAMTHQTLLAAGKKVGSYYSPHPTTSIERIKTGDKYIAPDEFIALIDRLKKIIDEMQLNSPYGAPSYFEILFAIALMHFQNKKCEYAVLEVGCGGEFDATNIIPRPEISVITNVGYDHMHILGRSLTKIATTKAGIIKKGSIFLTSEKRPNILKIFHNICQQKGCEYRQIKGEKNENLENNKLIVEEIGQILKIKSGAIEKGINETKLSCRFELIQKNPLVILDGAHNYDKLKTTFQNLKKIEFGKLFLILCLNENKQIKRIIHRLANEIRATAQIYLTRHLVAGRSCADLKMMYTLFPSVHKKNIFVYTDPWQALNTAIQKARRNDLILVTGSFYLAGLLRQKWISEKQILKVR